MRHGKVKLCTQIFNQEKGQIEPGEVIAETSCSVSFSRKAGRYNVKFPSGLELKKDAKYFLVFPWLWSKSRDGMESASVTVQHPIQMTQFSFRKQ